MQSHLLTHQPALTLSAVVGRLRLPRLMPQAVVFTLRFGLSAFGQPACCALLVLHAFARDVSCMLSDGLQLHYRLLCILHPW